MSSRFKSDTDWDNDPLVGPSKKRSNARYRVEHGGPGPTPGSEEAASQGCFCPGKVGDRDRWGREGYTVDRECPFHGDIARSDNEIRGRLSNLRGMGATDDQLRRFMGEIGAMEYQYKFLDEILEVQADG